MIEATRHLVTDFVIPIAVSIAAPGYVLAWALFPIWWAYELTTFLDWRLRQ